MKLESKAIQLFVDEIRACEKNREQLKCKTVAKHIRDDKVKNLQWNHESFKDIL